MISVVGCRILVKPFELQEHDKTFASAKKTGLILLETSERKEQINIDKGTVVEIGSKCHADYVANLQVGDTIGYAKFGGKFVHDNDDTMYLVISDEDVVCIYKE